MFVDECVRFSHIGKHLPVPSLLCPQPPIHRRGGLAKHIDVYSSAASTIIGRTSSIDPRLSKTTSLNANKCPYIFGMFGIILSLLGTTLCSKCSVIWNMCGLFGTVCSNNMALSGCRFLQGSNKWAVQNQGRGPGQWLPDWISVSLRPSQKTLWALRFSKSCQI